MILNQGTLLHQLFLSLCASCGFQPNIVLECKHMDSIFDLVSQHMGISLLTDRHFDASVRTSAAGQHLKLIPLAPALYSQDVSVLFKKYDTQCDSDRNAGIYEGVYKIRLTDEVFSFISLRQARPVPHTIECTLCEHSIVMH